jgi:hypothetical protein
MHAVGISVREKGSSGGQNRTANIGTAKATQISKIVEFQGFYYAMQHLARTNPQLIRNQKK